MGARRFVRVLGVLGVLSVLAALVTQPNSASASSTAGTWALDPSFGSGGVVRTLFDVPNSRFAWGFGSLVQPDGRIVVAGVASSGLQDRLALARYLPDGRLDNSFGDHGKVLVGPHALYEPQAIALQQVNGTPKLVLAVETTFKDPYRYRCSVVRLNLDGSLDTDHDGDPSVMFGNEGTKVVTVSGNSGFCGGLAVLPNQELVVSAEADTNDGDVALFRLHALRGGLDHAFGTGGIAIIPAPGEQAPGAVAIQPLGAGRLRILTAGVADDPHGTSWAMWGMHPNGTVDDSFGTDGEVVIAMRAPKVQQSFDSATSLVVTASGGVVVGGDYRAWPRNALLPQDTAALAAYTPDGQLDPAFGTNGVTHLPYDRRGSTGVESLALGPGGGVLFSGALEMPTSGALLAGGVDATGAPDPSFGAGGYLELPLAGGPYTSGNAIELDQHGRLVVAGIDGAADGQGQDTFGVIRLTR